MRIYEGVAFMKKKEGAGGFKIWMVGGTDFLDVFMKERFIDELIITISVRLRLTLLKLHNPYQELQLIHSQRYGQMVQLHYKVKKEALYPFF